MIEARFRGFFPPDFHAAAPVVMDIRDFSTAPSASYMAPPIAVRDARKLQADAPSEADFFARHGFVLLDHETAVTDWSDGDALRRIYFPEIESLIQTRLAPGRPLRIIQANPPLRRGRDTGLDFYGDGVHQDFGLTPDDFAESAEAFGGAEAAARYRAGFAMDNVAGNAVFDFWRVTNMAGPLRHMPLALCDPASVEPADIVPSRLFGLAPSGKAQSQLSLRFNPAQRWYVYPDMRMDEVLVFKLFEYMKDEPVRLRGCYHSAFDAPGTPPDIQRRQSCEHRVNVFYLHEAIAPVTPD